MPVSSPSYFPPSRNSDRIVGITAGNNQTGNNVFLAGQSAGINSTSDGLIIIGHLAGNGGIVNAPNTLIIGIESGQSVTQSNTSGYSSADAGIIIGYNCLNKTASVNGSVVIGSNNFGQLSPAGSVANYRGIQNSVVLGSGMMNGANALVNPTSQIASSVIIGYGFNPNNTYWGGVNNCILIGRGICGTHYSNQLSSAVVIGTDACAQGVGTSVIAIGADVYPNDVQGLASYGIAIGANAAPNVNGTENSGTYIGRNAGENWAANKDWIIIGTPINATYKCDSYIAALPNPQNDGACNVGLGGATATNSNLDLAGARNIACLYKGTPGTVNPVDGGYFYVDGVNNTDMPLHWVDGTGADNSLSSSGPAFEGTGLGVISPAQLAATVNNFAPAGFAQAQVLRVTPAAGGTTLSGLAGGTTARLIRLTNISTADTLTIANLSANSLAANQIATPGGTNLGIVAQSSVTLWYDGTSGYWRVISWA